MDEITKSLQALIDKRPLLGRIVLSLILFVISMFVYFAEKREKREAMEAAELAAQTQKANQEQNNTEIANQEFDQQSAQNNYTEIPENYKV